MKNKVVILDRDGVLNKDLNYVYKLEDFELLSGVVESLDKIQQAGYMLIIITNQSGVGRGYYSLKQMEEFNNLLLSELKKQGIKIEKIYHCPHQPKDGCECRKPKTFMWEQANKDYNIDVSKSYSIGDKDTDTIFAKKIGLQTVVLDNGQYQLNENADYKVNSWQGIQQIIK